MRILLIVAAALLAGCSDPATPDVLPPEPAPPERQREAWSDVTWRDECIAPGCALTTHAFSEHAFEGVGADFRLDLTWESNDPANDQLTVDLGNGQTFRGGSPLSIQIAEPSEEMTMTVRGDVANLVVAYQDAPPQPFDATASFLPVDP